MRTAPLLIATALSFALLGCDKKDEAPPAPAAQEAPAEAPEAKKSPIDRGRLAVFSALPEYMTEGGEAPDAVKVELGRMLYFDTRLSKGQGISCNSCHQLDKFGVDGEPTSPGHKGQRGGRNSPTVFNAAGHMAQFWDGRAATVEEQAQGPMTNPIEMAMLSPEKIKDVLTSMPEYEALFAKAFPGEADPINIENAANAIGAFERGLTTPGRWDAFLKGKDDALTAEEIAGLEIFLNTGCQACHNGAYVGGNSYQKLGAVKPWPDLKDEGRFEATQSEADKYFFKVPSLRNIAKTGPYLHDGSVKTLPEMVSMMATHQLGRDLSEAEVASIVTYLKALTGEVDKAYTAQPELPPSTDKTPKADPT